MKPKRKRLPPRRKTRKRSSLIGFRASSRRSRRRGSHRGVFVCQPLIFSSYSRSMSATVTVIVRVKPVWARSYWTLLAFSG